MQIENKLKIKMENKTRYTRHDIAIMDLVAAFFQETTNKLKNKRNETEEILLLDHRYGLESYPKRHRRDRNAKALTREEARLPACVRLVLDSGVVSAARD